MDFKDYMLKENEKPLDYIKDDGGFTSIFRTIAVIGDSLSSGEFETCDSKGNRGYHDLYEYSWGQYIGRMIGAKVYNFSRGGMTAKEYMESFASQNDFFNPEKKCQAYIIALGVNDMYGRKMAIGTNDDIDPLHPENNNQETIMGWYGKIISKYKEISPDAKFFLLTIPKEDFHMDEPILFSNAINDLTKIFENVYVIDLCKYAPTYDEEFRKNFNLLGHLNPMGYVLTAKMVASYIDYIIRKNPEEFKHVGLINSGIQYKF